MSGFDSHKQRLYSQVAAIEASAGGAEAVDLAAYDWYASTCPCGLPPGECREHPRARASQRPPEGDWSRWFLMAGRGFGKTKAGAEWVRNLAETNQAKRIALVAPTADDVRNVMVEGDSGILSVSPPWFRPVYAPSLGRLTWPNGAIAECYRADEPERLRGPQHDHAWIDEPGAWRYDVRAYDMLMFGMRKGVLPRLVATSTPRATRLIKALAADPRTHLTRGTTYDNRTHLAPASSPRSSRNMKERAWASRRSTPSFWRSPRVRGSRCSRWRATFPSGPRTRRVSPCGSRSTPARPGTPVRCFSRSGRIVPAGRK